MYVHCTVRVNTIGTNINVTGCICKCIAQHFLFILYVCETALTYSFMAFSLDIPDDTLVSTDSGTQSSGKRDVSPHSTYVRNDAFHVQCDANDHPS